MELFLNTLKTANRINDCLFNQSEENKNYYRSHQINYHPKFNPHKVQNYYTSKSYSQEVSLGPIILKNRFFSQREIDALLSPGRNEQQRQLLQLQQQHQQRQQYRALQRRRKRLSSKKETSKATEGTRVVDVAPKREKITGTSATAGTVSTKLKMMTSILAKVSSKTAQKYAANSYFRITWLFVREWLAILVRIP